MTLYERIKQRRIELEMTQEELAKLTGYTSRTSIAKIENGSVDLPFNKIHIFAKALRIDDIELLGYKDEKLPDNLIMPSAKSLPIIGVICAGDGVYCQDDYQGRFVIDIQVDADFCLKVRGNSMEGAQIYDGDIAFIKKDDYFNDGDIYAVERLDLNEASLKKVYINDNSVMLIPCNSEYSPIATTLDQIRIIGRCVGVYHNR